MSTTAAQVKAAQTTLRKAVTAHVRGAGAKEALEQAADAILAVQGVIAPADWEGLWRAYVAAQTAPDHETRVEKFKAAEIQADALLKQAAQIDLQADQHHTAALYLLLAAH
jgi:hypothetical protein